MLFPDQSGDRLHRGSVRNRLAHLIDLEEASAAERFSLLTGVRVEHVRAGFGR